MHCFCYYWVSSSFSLHSLSSLQEEKTITPDTAAHLSIFLSWLMGLSVCSQQGGLHPGPLPPRLHSTIITSSQPLPSPLQAQSTWLICHCQCFLDPPLTNICIYIFSLHAPAQSFDACLQGNQWNYTAIKLIYLSGRLVESGMPVNNVW